MKIRTSFVTNSSSYSSAEIRIDNPVLLEILMKYKEKGAFIGKNLCDFGYGIGSSEREQIGPDRDDKPLAFCVYDPETAEIDFAPKRIKDIVGCIMDIIADERNRKYLKNEALFMECEKELRERAEEINKNYIEVSWEASNDSYGDSEPDEGDVTSWKYHYKKK